MRCSFSAESQLSTGRASSARASASGADHPVPLRARKYVLSESAGWAARVERGLHLLSDPLAFWCAGCLVAPSSSFTGASLCACSPRPVPPAAPPATDDYRHVDRSCSTCRGRSPWPAWSAGALRPAGSAQASSTRCAAEQLLGPSWIRSCSRSPCWEAAGPGASWTRRRATLRR